MRVSAAAFPLMALDASAWVARFTAQARTAADAGAALVLFPEYVTVPLLTVVNDWSAWTDLWRRTAQVVAKEFGMLVVAGTHLVQDGSQRRNRCLLAWPDGTLEHQDKLHPTPWERRWELAATDSVRLFRHAGATLALPICYDVEFPEGVRVAAEAGAEVLLVPSWTDDDHGFWRVRHCAQARCIENVVYAVHAPLVGGLASPPDFEQACGAAGVLTPCDIGFHRAGLAADGGWNQAVVVTAELDLTRLRQLRAAGTVTPFADRRGAAGYRVWGY
jgi:predicted amidohydrolase